jgi:hypothetical protein
MLLRLLGTRAHARAPVIDYDYEREHEHELERAEFAYLSFVVPRLLRT